MRPSESSSELGAAFNLASLPVSPVCDGEPGCARLPVIGVVLSSLIELGSNDASVVG